jgi:hypothetical protein
MSTTKLCECGCGQPAPIAAATRIARGHVKGQPLRFLPAHNNRLRRKHASECSVDGCPQPTKGRGWCSTHYWRWKKHGDPVAEVFIPADGCKVDGCESQHSGLGYCKKHYTRLLRHGNLIGLRPRENELTRFWMRVDKDGPTLVPELGPCWIWTAARGDHGYGTFCPAGAPNVGAHRYSYELHHGPIAEGLLACHRCDNPPCVNPGHLFAGTHSDNMRDMVAKGRHARRKEAS